MKIVVIGETNEFDIQVAKNLVDKIIKNHDGSLDVEYVKITDKIELKGFPTLKAQISVILREVYAREPNLDLAVVLFDADTRDITAINKRVREIKAKIVSATSSRAEKTIVGYATTSIEAWLLSDMGAINRLTGGTYPEEPTAENINDPKMKLKEIWKGSGTSTTKNYSSFCIDISHEIDINVCCQKSKSLTKLKKQIIIQLNRLQSER